MFDGVGELEQADGTRKLLCNGCYAIRCQFGFGIRHFTDKFNLPIISCLNGRWTFQNTRRDGLLENATNAAGQLRSTLICKKRQPYWERDTKDGLDKIVKYQYASEL